MKNKYLLPKWCRPFGFLITIPGLILGYVFVFHGYMLPGFGFNMRNKPSLLQGQFENFTNELAIFLVVIGLTCMAFAKSRKEDELTSKIRLNALYWSVFIYYSSYIFFLLATLIFGEIPFISEHSVELSIVTPLLIFNLRLYYLQHASKERFIISAPRFLPYKPFRLVGILFTLMGAAGLIYGLVTESLLFSTDNASAISFFSFLLGLLFWAFSKHQIEDEMMIQHRMESLQVAFYFNYVLFLVATLTVYSLSYLLVVNIGQFSLLLYFIIRMEYVRYSNQKTTDTFEGEIKL